MILSPNVENPGTTNTQIPRSQNHTISQISRFISLFYPFFLIIDHKQELYVISDCFVFESK